MASFGLGEAMTHIYQPVWFEYTRKLFDNTAKTYLTDFALGVFMLFGLYSLKANAPPSPLRTRTMALVVLYAVSVFTGGLGHLQYTSLESINSTWFRVLWCLTTGSVALAGGVLGSIGSHLPIGAPTRQGGGVEAASSGTVQLCGVVQFVPDWLWFTWGVCMLAVVVGGGMSMERPAADIFIAGATQSVPTFYLVVNAIAKYFMWQGDKFVSWSTVLSLSTFALLNAPLIVLYPLILYFTDLSLGTVNAGLHCWLTVAWGGQYFYLKRYCMTMPRSTSSAKLSADENNSSILGRPPTVPVDTSRAVVDFVDVVWMPCSLLLLGPWRSPTSAAVAMTLRGVVLVRHLLSSHTSTGKMD